MLTGLPLCKNRVEKGTYFAALLALLALQTTPLSAASQRIVDSQGRDYFPPEISALTPECQYSWNKDPPKLIPLLSASYKSDVARNLRVARESSIVGKAQLAKYPEVVRFVWWHDMWSTVTIRVEMGPKKSRLTAKMASWFYNDYKRRLARTLTNDEVRQFTALLRETRLFDSRPDDCAIVLDGTNWFLETNGPKGYDFVERTSPGADKPAFIVGKFLFGLTGWKTGMLQYEIENARIDEDEE